MSFGIDVKKLLSEKAAEAVRKYEQRPEVQSRFGAPLIGYALADHPLFYEFFLRRMTKHPKEIFRPGNTVIVHFVPFDEQIVKSNRGGSQVSEEWKIACGEAIMLSTHINGAILSALSDLGRVTSGTNLPGDWDEETCAPAWSHKLAAFVAGMGEFGFAGAFHTQSGFAGRFGTAITEFPMEPSKAWRKEELAQMDEICKRIELACAYQALEGKHNIDPAVCPAGAIAKSGVDRYKCQDFCKSLDQPAPSPDMCAKCFYPA